jgi:hypothetical protein
LIIGRRWRIWKMNFLIPKAPIDEFDWISWRNGYHIWIKLGFSARYYNIIDNKKILQRYAVGYRHGSEVFRPEENEFAVLFLIDDIFGWTHLTEKEFLYVFGI